MRILQKYRPLLIGMSAAILAVLCFALPRNQPPTIDTNVRAELISEVDADDPEYMIFAPDGKTVALTSAWRINLGEITLIDVDTCLPRDKIPGYDLQFTKNGLMAAKSGQDICFYDLDTLELKKRIALPGWGRLGISPNGDVMTFMLGGRQVLVQEIDGGKRIASFPGTEYRPQTATVFSTCGWYAAFPDGSLIRVADMKALKQLHALSRGAEPEIEFMGRKGADICFSPDSRYLAAVRDRDEVRLWDVFTGKMTPISVDWRGVGAPQAAAFSPDGRLIASGGADVAVGRLRFTDPWANAGGVILLSDARTGELLWSKHLEYRQDEPASRCVHALAFSPDGTLLAAASRESLMLWKIDVKEKAED